MKYKKSDFEQNCLTRFTRLGLLQKFALFETNRGDVMLRLQNCAMITKEYELDKHNRESSIVRYLIWSAKVSFRQSISFFLGHCALLSGSDRSSLKQAKKRKQRVKNHYKMNQLSQLDFLLSSSSSSWHQPKKGIQSRNNNAQSRILARGSGLTKDVALLVFASHSFW